MASCRFAVVSFNFDLLSVSLFQKGHFKDRIRTFAAFHRTERGYPQINQIFADWRERKNDLRNRWYSLDGWSVRIHLLLILHFVRSDGRQIDGLAWVLWSTGGFCR
ncbi:MAG: hypothetical protein JWM04_2427 [Verrucomicrobiales bacterium]|nr:hypothetical protein [Verrucomicrobiales bacterium]